MAVPVFRMRDGENRLVDKNNNSQHFWHIRKVNAGTPQQVYHLWGTNVVQLPNGKIALSDYPILTYDGKTLEEVEAHAKKEDGFAIKHGLAEDYSPILYSEKHPASRLLTPHELWALDLPGGEAPVAEGVDWRPNETIPEDFYSASRSESVIRYLKTYAKVIGE